jgi:hypothetical protein
MARFFGLVFLMTEWRYYFVALDLMNYFLPFVAGAAPGFGRLVPYFERR